MNMKNFVIGILGTLAFSVIVMIVTIISTPDEAEARVVERIQYEDVRTRMQDVLLVPGKDWLDYRIQATYKLSSIARKSDRRMCEAKIADLITEIVSHNEGSQQIFAAINRGLNTFTDTTEHNDNCSVQEPYVTVAGPYLPGERS